MPNTHRHLITSCGYKVALLFTKLTARIFRTTFAAFDAEESVPWPLAHALPEANRQIGAIINHAKLQETT